MLLGSFRTCSSVWSLWFRWFGVFKVMDFGTLSFDVGSLLCLWVRFHFDFISVSGTCSGITKRTCDPKRKNRSSTERMHKTSTPITTKIKQNKCGRFRTWLCHSLNIIQKNTCYVQKKTNNYTNTQTRLRRNRHYHYVSLWSQGAIANATMDYFDHMA